MVETNSQIVMTPSQEWKCYHAFRKEAHLLMWKQGLCLEHYPSHKHPQCIKENPMSFHLPNTHSYMKSLRKPYEASHDVTPESLFLEPFLPQAQPPHLILILVLTVICFISSAQLYMLVWTSWKHTSDIAELVNIFYTMFNLNWWSISYLGSTGLCIS